jgi:glycerophosphoryl diester phosphodiesterase
LADSRRHFVGLAGSYSPIAQAVQVPEYRGNIHILTPRFVKDAHSRGMDVHVWTVNEAEGMQRMIDLGVDGIITDRPDILLELLGRSEPKP